jgi:hypothetical protein
VAVERAELSAANLALYSKLDASHGDIGTARACAAYIQTNGWHTSSYLRRGTIGLQQTAFTTTMIVAYARPFSSGRGNIKFPHELLAYGPDEQDLHARLLQLRRQEYAHTDAAVHKVIPLKGDFIKSIESLRSAFFSPAQITLFLDMTDALMERIRDRMEQLRRGL